ncbi:MAG: sulfotransferase family 2 domain-containing protein [Candidatus Promineifilaceae bacterium]|jgi:hypothetical protein
MTQQVDSEMVQEKRGQTAVIFLHIPKTAGTTLLEILDRQYSPETIFSLGSIAQESIAQFEAMDEQERANIRLLRGHLAYGLHEYLPGPAQYFTILRDPVARVISHYNFILRTPEHYLYDRVVEGNLSLYDLLQENYALMLNDAQVRLVSGVWGDAPFGEVTLAMLETAKENLTRSFPVVGLMEQFDKTVLLLKETFNWPAAITYHKRNVTKKGMTVDSLPPQTLARIKEVNRQDQALYEFGRELFKEQCARQGPGFDLRVRYFQRVNQYGQPFQRLRTFSVRTKLKELVNGGE